MSKRIEIRAEPVYPGFVSGLPGLSQAVSDSGVRIIRLKLEGMTHAEWMRIPSWVIRQTSGVYRMEHPQLVLGSDYTLVDKLYLWGHQEGRANDVLIVPQGVWNSFLMKLAEVEVSVNKWLKANDTPELPDSVREAIDKLDCGCSKEAVEQIAAAVLKAAKKKKT